MTPQRFAWIMEKLGFVHVADRFVRDGLTITMQQCAGAPLFSMKTDYGQHDHLSFSLLAGLCLNLTSDAGCIGLCRIGVHVVFPGSTGVWISWREDGAGLALECIRDPGLLGVLRDWLEDHSD